MCASNRSPICVNVSLSTSGFVSYTSVTSICYVSRVPSPASAISLALTTAPSAMPHMLAITPYHSQNVITFQWERCVFLLLFTFSITVKNYFSLVLMSPQ